MTTSLKDFAKNFQTIETTQLNTIVGGNGGLVQLMAINRRKKKFG
ncbi:ComC/BlpC family leader-containing pheromone/bacteriocin [Streptococcus pluranimalium]